MGLRLNCFVYFFLLFHKAAADQTDASRSHKTAYPPLPPEEELKFLDADDAPGDETDFPDDLDEDDSVSRKELSSVWEEINKLTPLGSVIDWPSKPNKKVPVMREPRLCKGLVQIYFIIQQVNSFNQIQLRQRASYCNCALL